MELKWGSLFFVCSFSIPKRQLLGTKLQVGIREQSQACEGFPADHLAQQQQTCPMLAGKCSLSCPAFPKWAIFKAGEFSCSVVSFIYSALGVLAAKIHISSHPLVYGSMQLQIRPSLLDTNQWCPPEPDLRSFEGSSVPSETESEKGSLQRSTGDEALLCFPFQATGDPSRAALMGQRLSHCFC